MTWGLYYKVDGMYVIDELVIYTPDMNPTLIRSINLHDSYEHLLIKVIIEYERDFAHFKHNPWWNRIVFGGTSDDEKEKIYITIDDLRNSHPYLFI